MSDLMAAREFLEQPGVIESKIRQKQERLASLKAMMGLSSPKLRDMPKVPSPNQQPLDYFVAASVDVENEIKALSAELEQARRTVGVVVAKVDDEKQKEVLEVFYIGNRNLEQTARIMGNSTRQITRWHTKAITSVAKLLSTD